MDMERFEVELVYQKDTKGTIVVGDANGNPSAPIRTLYITKGALKVQPKRVKVTVEVLE